MKPRYTDKHRYRHGYKPAIDTNIAATFERARREHAALAARDQANEVEASAKVEQLSTRRST